MCDKPVDELTVMKENVCKKSKGNKSARRLGGQTNRQKDKEESALQGPYFGFSRSSPHPTPQSRPEPWTERLFLQFQFGRPCLISQI